MSTITRAGPLRSGRAGSLLRATEPVAPLTGFTSTLSRLHLRVATGAVVLLIASAVIGLFVELNGASAHDGAAPASTRAAVSPASESPLAATTTLRTATPPKPPSTRHSSTAPPPRHAAAPPRRVTTPAPPTVTVPTLRANRLSIPALHVIAHVDMCATGDRTLRPPANVQRTCYWTNGAPVFAATGTTAIVGETDWIGLPPAALGRVDRLDPGDTIVTSGPQAQLTRWRVVSVAYRDKRSGVEPAAFVGRRGARRLYLITGGGRYDTARHAFLDNVYVHAEPVLGGP